MIQIPKPQTKSFEVIEDFVFGDNKLYILWGSVSSGKTICSLLAFLSYLESAPINAPYAFIGKTERTLSANVLDVLADELGEFYTENLGRGFVNIFGRKIRVYGANDAKAETKIRGKTLQSFYGDEVTTWPENFFMMAISRLRLPGAKAIMTTNPDSRNHWFYKNVVKRAIDGEIDAKLYKFVMEDNPYLPKDYIDWIKRMYAPGTIWHSRFILGEWSSAEGRVFPFFDRSKNVIKVEELPDTYRYYILSVDYGISNPFAAVLWGLRDNTWYIIREFYYDSRKEGRQLLNSDYIRRLADMCIINNTKIFPEILVPPEEPEFIKELRRSPFNQIQHVKAANNEILPGIADLSSLLYSGQLKISEECETCIWGLEELVWDVKACEAGRDMYEKGGSGSPDHICDAMRYGARDALKHLRMMREGRYDTY